MALAGILAQPERYLPEDTTGLLNPARRRVPDEVAVQTAARLAKALVKALEEEA